MKENIHQTVQIIGGVVAEDNLRHQEQLRVALKTQDSAFTKAVEQIDKVLEFVGDPGHILGNDKTKHGEIAEQVEVAVHNARNFLHQQAPTGTFEGVDRTAPTDYLINGVQVQSKFINGINKNLDHVLEHMHKYEDFGRDRSYYHIPKDYYETISKVLKGESVEGLSERTLQKIEEKAKEIQELSGKPFNKVVQPSVSRYDEVHKGKIHDTVDKHEQEIDDENKRIKDGIKENAQPNLKGMGNAAVKGALIGGGIRLAFKVYQKSKQGKNPFRGNYTADDWKELGIDTLKGGAVGGISAAAIYALTNFTDLTAPFASGMVSAGLSIASLVKSLNAGEITFEQFTEMSQMVCIESAAVTLFSALGQAIIPIPILGAVLGTIAGRIVLNWTKQYLGKETERLKRQLEEQYNQHLKRIDQAYRVVLSKIIAEFEKLGDLTRAAFDTSKNVALRLQASINLAEAYKVSSVDIIRNTSELDAFMLS